MLAYGKIAIAKWRVETTGAGGPELARGNPQLAANF